MTLRAKIFGLFLLLAATPLLLLGVVMSRSAERAVDALVQEQLRHLAERAAQTIERRHELHRSDMLLLSENTETVQLYGARQGSTVLSSADRDSSVAYLHDLWLRMRDEYAAIALADVDRRPWHLFGDTAPGDWARVVDEPVTDRQTGDTLGYVRAYVRQNALLPIAELTARFGTGGRMTVIDRSTGGVIFAADPRPADRSAGGDAALLAEDSDGRAVYTARLAQPAWDVRASTSQEEFTAPFARLARWNLAVLLAVVLLTTTAFGVLLHRATQSLRALTSAADAIGRGELDPAIPPAGGDDVGRLAGAFDTMVARIREMIAQLRASRQMAVLGEFAARLSHELRNPLTAVKLNLQALDRDARAGRLSADEAARPLAIALGELDRLDNVLRNVLDLARPGGAERSATSVHVLLEQLRDLLSAQARQRGVRIDVFPGADDDMVVADAGQLKGALLNLLLNGLDAAPAGTALEVTSANPVVKGSRVLEIRIRDSGSGVPVSIRGEIFRPFYTTRPGGTGLGLSLAARAAEELGGSLQLAEGAPGAEFVVRLPLPTAIEAPVPAGAG